MMRYEDMLEIQLLHHQGCSVRKIARELGISRNTVRKYLSMPKEEEPNYTHRQSTCSKLDEYKPYLQQRRQFSSPDNIPATVLFREIYELGYRGSISLLRSYIRQLSPIKEETITRFETPAGKQLQVDWAEFCRSPQLSAFIATLGYSRLSYVEFVENKKLDNLLSCLINAFDYFGGVTNQILFDNMKSVVIQRHAYGEGQHRFQKTLWDFAKHYGFIPKLCAPYRAQTKGKVERFIGYLRHSFYVPLRTSLAMAGLKVDVNSANTAVKTWLSEVANVRVHATLNEQPIQRFTREKTQLLPLPPTPYSGIRVMPTIKTSLHRPLPIDDSLILQHHLNVYQQLLEQQ